MPRRLGPGLLAALLAFAPAAAARPQAGPGPIAHGTALPLTGPLASAGSAIRAGMLVWIEEANANGGLAGRRVGLIAEDGGGDPGRTVSAERTLARGRLVALVDVCCGLPEGPPVGDTPVLFPMGGGFGASTPPWARFAPATSPDSSESATRPSLH